MRTLGFRPHHLAGLALAVAGLFIFASCQKDAQKTAGTDDSQTVQFSQETAGVPQPGQELFVTPQQAAAVLKDAVQTKDRRQLIHIFGHEGSQLIFTGDRVQEDSDLDAFAAHLAEYLRVDAAGDNRAILYVGAENWPYPIPIVKSGDGWFFDTVAGKDELLNRRIGENELNAIAVCRACVAAQKEYASKDRMGDHVIQYAQHFRSSEGKKDGLYWAATEGEELSPMGPLVAQAHAEGYGKEPSKPGEHRPYKGYYFHILTSQGEAAPGGKMDYIVNGKMVKGFAMVALPDRWGASGVMTFIVNQDGKVYQKNVGGNVLDIAKAINEYNPDSTWEEVKD